ncbi:cleft lip and palate transmembrane protein 1-domain-containing protein [Polychytrium aggregatum]|uniref:cleft lip and palate transmembrane protein 1-domain-containing protein n=1 Tax=Polychytrium aggregatum TaxID=110093 RepID=UPI0022FE9D50|nr:cleft lip and palate transmembrane protein 1-domain-containing protein [Polychytrium aggregatum]KAI9193337.1 cleft lip and palate transmembrane protein 1-domain-containing protein [Polychytrium aggregatum]
MTKSEAADTAKAEQSGGTSVQKKDDGTTSTTGAAGNQSQQAPKEENGLMGLIGMVGRMALIYFAVQYFTGGFNKKAPATNQPVVGLDGENVAQATPAAPPQGSNQVVNWHPGWPETAKTNLWVYISEDEYFADFTDESKLVWTETNIKFYKDYTDQRIKNIVVPFSENVQNNGSLYAHIYLTLDDASPNPRAKSFHPDKGIYRRKLLTRYMKKKKVVAKKNLFEKDQLTNEEELAKAVEEAKNTPIVSYWWSNLTIHGLGDYSTIASNLPPTFLKEVQIHSSGQHYMPVVWINDFWMLQDQLIPINDTVKSANLTLRYSAISLWQMQMYLQFEESFRVQTQTFGQSQSETDELKRMFTDTNPILLGVTFVVSLLHSLFDFLAFKNDIDFWRNRKDMEGLSFRTIVLNVVQQFIIFLYLLDNETSWMILLSSGAGLLIETWKIHKTVIVKSKPEFPYIEFIDRVKPSRLTSKTKKYDAIAFKYLSYALVPLLIGYTIYSMMYESHKSWYSFIIGTLVGFVYMFGFITMTPQLFINYKLKSVAHMPWKTFMYKALNTFIDDLFAFVIKMPWLHRLACLRDDVVFLIYLYQRWVYPEDKRRRNEFVSAGALGCVLAAFEAALGLSSFDHSRAVAVREIFLR